MVLALFRKKLGLQRTPGYEPWRRRTQKGNDLGQVGAAAIDAVFGVGSVEQMPSFKDIPDLGVQVSHRLAWAEFAYHTADIPNIDFITPRGLENDLWRLVNVWLHVLYVHFLAPRSRAKITEDM